MLLLRSIKKILTGRWCTVRSHLRSLSLRIWVCHPNTRIAARLLGPCFKTGRLEPFRQHPKRSCGCSRRGLPRRPCRQHAVGRTASRGGRAPKCSAAVLGPPQRRTGGYNSPPVKAGSPSSGFLPRPEPMLTCLQESAPPKTAADDLQPMLVSSASLLTISRTV